MGCLHLAPDHFSTACTCGEITSLKAASCSIAAGIRHRVTKISFRDSRLCKRSSRLTCLPTPITRPVPLFRSTRVRMYRNHSTNRRTSELGNPFLTIRPHISCLLPAFLASFAHSGALVVPSVTSRHHSISAYLTRCTPVGATAAVAVAVGLAQPLQAPPPSPSQRERGGGHHLVSAGTKDGRQAHGQASKQVS
ncbi:hypothetical protein BKA80DRAFT_67276 [Phyllosticta citrichinensis]